MGRFYDSARLEKRRSELSELTCRYKGAYSAAYDYLAAAGTLKLSRNPAATNDNINGAVKNCLALLPDSVPGAGAVRHCFIDAFTGKGAVSLLASLEDWRIYTVRASDYDGSTVLKRLGDTLAGNAYGAFFAHSPLEPDMLRHLIIPCHKTVFTVEHVPECTCAAALSYPKPDDKLSRRHNDLLVCAEEMLALAKRNHDALEEVYNPCVDFGGIYSEAQRHIDTIL